MANNKSNTPTENGTEKQLPNELFQLRDILFGEDKREFEAHFNDLEKKTEQQIERLNANFSHEINELRQNMDKSFALLSDRLSDADHGHNEREDEIKQFAENTAERLAQFEKITHQTTVNLTAKMDEETKKLSHDIDEQYQQVLAKINDVSLSLQSSKTDRKLLAQILSSAAQTLEQVDN